MEPAANRLSQQDFHQLVQNSSDNFSVHRPVVLMQNCHSFRQLHFNISRPCKGSIIVTAHHKLLDYRYYYYYQMLTPKTNIVPESRPKSSPREQPLKQY